MERIKFVSGDRSLFNDYMITSFIAKGNNTVYQTVHKQNKQDIQCVKEIRLVDRNSEAIFEKEVKLLESLSKEPHEGIIDFRGSYVISQELSEFNCCKKGFIQMEKGITSLDHLIADRVQTGVRFTETQIIHFMMAMIEAHKHLQSKAIAHRDIKPENIILVGMDPLSYKVCDVGVGTAVGSDSTRTRTLMGTVSYLSPELLKAYRENKYNVAYNPHRSDVYSLGLVAIYFCSLGKLLSKDRGEDEEEKVLLLIKQIKRSYKGIHGLSKTLKQMLKYNETQRPDFFQLYNKIQENGWLKLKYDALRTASLQKFMSHSIPLQGATQIKSAEEAPLLQMYTENPKVLHSLRIDLPGMNKNNQQMKEIMGDLRRMKDLDLNKLSVNLELNSIQGETIKGLCDGIEKNVHLEELQVFLWNNDLGNPGFSLVIDVFRKLPQLKNLYLNLSSNNISDFPAFITKIASLQNLSSLQEFVFDIGLNRLTSESIPHLFNAFSKMTSLKKLKFNLQSNRITPLALKSLPQCLSSLKNLRQLSINLSGNRVGNEGMYALGDLLQVIPNLISYELILWNAEITDKGIIEFMRSTTGNCKQIREFRLVLWNNAITEKAIETMGTKLTQFESLEKIYVNLSNNKIGDGGVRLLNKSMIELPMLREVKLGLDCTSMTEVGCRYIGRMLSVQKNIHKFDLSLRANNIGLAGLQFLTAGLKQSRKLTHLWIVLEGCKVGDDGVSFLSKVFPRFRQLHSIYINVSDCNLYDDGMFTLIHAMQTNIHQVKEISVDLRRNTLSPVMRNRIQYEVANDKRVEIKLDEAN